MKRRSFQTIFTVPSHIATDLHGPQEISRAKRGDFMDWKNAHPPSCKADADASSIPIGGTHGDDPKTSEYAYFKKLKRDASQSFCPQVKDDDQLKKFKSVDCGRDTKIMVKDRSKDPKSSLCIHEFTPIVFNSFLSPHGGAPKNSDTKNMVKHSSKDPKSSSCLNEFASINCNSFLSPHGGASKNSDADLKGAYTLLGDTCSIHKYAGDYGMQCIDEEAFSRKRRRLRQWVDVSFPDIDMLCSKGYDFISALLSRLSPRPSENKSSKGQNLLPVEIDTKTKPLASSGTYICSNKLQYSSVQNFEGLESEPHLNFGSSFCQIDKSKEKPLWKWNLGCNLPTFPSSKFPLQCQKEKPDYDLDSESSACLWTENDSTSGFSFKKYELGSSHLKEVDEFCDRKEQMPRREPHSLLLDLDFGNMKDDKILSIASPNMELNMSPMLPISWADDYWPSGDNSFDASGLFPSSLLSYTSLAHSYSDSYHNYGNGQHCLAERKCLIARLHRFPLTLSDYPNLIEDCTYDNSCKDGSIVCSPQDYRWSMRMSFNDKLHLGLGTLLLSSGFDSDLRPRHLLLADYPGEHHSSAYQALEFPKKDHICSHFVEDEFTSWLDNSNKKETLVHFPGDILNIRDWSSINLLMSLNKETSCPLLPDKPSWVASEAEIDVDDCEGKHILDGSTCISVGPSCVN